MTLISGTAWQKDLTEMRKRFYKIVNILIFCVFVISGCGTVSELSFDTMQVGSEGEEITTLGLSPEFDYEVPESLPSILVNQVGYACRSDKTALFRGEGLPDTFSVVDAESEQIVYSGQIEREEFAGGTEEPISYGDFTEFETAGTYYIQAAKIGQSYTFVIEDNPYRELYHTALKKYYYNRCGLTLSSELAGEAARNACHAREAQLKDEAAVNLDVSGGWHVDELGNRDVSKGCRTADYLLLAYELYPDVFDDQAGIPESGNEIPDVLDEVKYEIDWLLKMQDATSGAVYAGVNTADNKASGYLLYVDGFNMNATIQFAATLAKFSYLYQNYDRVYATQCLQAADRAYRYAGKYLNDITQEEYFHAATELYRATGAYGYHSVVKDYLLENPITEMKNDYVFLGCVTYLSTKQKVDVSLCGDVMKILMQEGERIAEASKNSGLLVNIDEKQGGDTEMLRDIARLTVVDHIITNHEYARVLQNHLHYMLGCNMESVSYLDGTGSRNYKNIDESLGIMNQIDLNAELVLMMSAIMEELDAD